MKRFLAVLLTAVLITTSLLTNMIFITAAAAADSVYALVDVDASSAKAQQGEPENPALAVFDGDAETRWGAMNADETVTAVLFAEYTIDAVEIRFFRAAARAHYFKIEYSNNGSSWTEAKLTKPHSTPTGDGDAEAGYFESFPLEKPVTAKYWRYTYLGRENFSDGITGEGPTSTVGSVWELYFAGGLAIGSGETIIESVLFDEDEYYESNLAEIQHGFRVHDVQTEIGGSGFLGNVGWTAGGEWVQYTVNVAKAGSYRFEACLASGATPAGQVEVSVGGKKIGTTATENNAGWGGPFEWEYVGEASLTAGTHVIKVLFPEGSTNFAALKVTQLGGYVLAPGTVIIEATHFDSGKHGVFGTDWGPTYTLRPNDLVPTEIGESGYEGNVGWTVSDAWVQYTVEVSKSAAYKFEAYLASGGGAGAVDVSIDGKKIGTSASYSADGWQSYNWVSVGTVTLDEGTYVIRVDFPAGEANFAALRVSGDTYPASSVLYGIEAPESELVKGYLIGSTTGWGENADRGRDAAFDGKADTFFDPTNGQDTSDYVGIRTDVPYTLTEIRIMPRDGYLGRFEGASIYGFNGDTFDLDTAVLIWRSDAAADAAVFQVIKSDELLTDEAFGRFVYYNDFEWGNVAEIELYGYPLNVFAGAAFVEGGNGFNNEGPENMFNYTVAGGADKYCMRTDEHGPFYAVWKYDAPVTAEKLMIATGGDSRANPRRMGDYTLSGSKDGENWTVIYEGNGAEDYGNEDLAFYFIDLNNKTAYSFYKIYCEEGADGNLIQISELSLIGKEGKKAAAGGIITLGDVYALTGGIIASYANALDKFDADPTAYVEAVKLITAADITRYRLETGFEFNYNAPATRQDFAIAVDKMLNILKKYGVEIRQNTAAKKGIGKVDANSQREGSGRGSSVTAYDVNAFIDMSEARASAQSTDRLGVVTIGAMEAAINLGVLNVKALEDKQVFYVQDPKAKAEDKVATDFSDEKFVSLNEAAAAKFEKYLETRSHLRNVAANGYLAPNDLVTADELADFWTLLFESDIVKYSNYTKKVMTAE